MSPVVKAEVNMHSHVSRIFLSRTLIATCPVVFAVHARVFEDDSNAEEGCIPTGDTVDSSSATSENGKREIKKAHRHHLKDNVHRLLQRRVVALCVRS